MSIEDANWFEEQFAEVRADFARNFALGLRNELPDRGNEFKFGQTDLALDRSRQIVASDFSDIYWTVRDGKQTMATSTIHAQGNLATFVGRKRTVFADDALRIIAGCLAEYGFATAGRIVSRFVNLALVQSCIEPQDDLRIWSAIAVAVARNEDSPPNLYALISGINSDFDIFHEELPDNQYKADLSPGAGPGPKATAGEQEASLLTSIWPEMRAAVEQLQTDEKRHECFMSKERELRRYITEQVFGRVATLVSSLP